VPFDYLEKPFKVEELKLCVQRALSYNAAISESAFLRKQLKKKYQFSQIIGSSAKMQDVFKMIERVADTESTVSAPNQVAMPSQERGRLHQPSPPDRARQEPRKPGQHRGIEKALEHC
jgi:DNA-binding response OmpR family regulator